MFELLIKTSEVVERYRKAPLAQEREQFIGRFHSLGHSERRVKEVNTMLLAIASSIAWGDAKISAAKLETAAEQWLASRVYRQVKEETTRYLKRNFILIGTSWLRSIGRFAECSPAPFEAELLSFLNFLDEERGLAAYTIALRRASLRRFLDWLAQRYSSIGDVTPRTITEYFSVDRQWSRATVKFHVNGLRSFFRFAGSKAWCDPKLPTTIDAPRIYAYESLPQGLTWPDVQRLIAAVPGTDRLAIRDRAAILLLALYGLRTREIVQLTLDDLDWSGERLYVRRSKQRKLQQFPLCAEVGDAIIRYLREVRPRSAHRHLFLTERKPYRPYSRVGFAKSISTAIKSLGVSLTHYGPHVLRHACATHLLAQGFSFKEIGDHLGHRSTDSTRIYAKVDLRSLRQVADLGLSGLNEDANRAEHFGLEDVAPKTLASLREVGELGIGGIA